MTNGESLRDRAKRGRLPIADVLSIADAIVVGLETGTVRRLDADHVFLVEGSQVELRDGGADHDVIHALGAMLRELTAEDPDAPPGLGALIARMLDEQTDERPTLPAVLYELRACQAIPGAIYTPFPGALTMPPGGYPPPPIPTDPVVARPLAPVAARSVSWLIVVGSVVAIGAVLAVYLLR